MTAVVNCQSGSLARALETQGLTGPKRKGEARAWRPTMGGAKGSSLQTGRALVMQSGGGSLELFCMSRNAASIMLRGEVGSVCVGVGVCSAV